MHGKGTFFDPRLDDATAVPGRGARTASVTCARRRPTIGSRRKLPRCTSISWRCRAEAAAGQLRRRGRQARRRRCSTARRKCATCHVPPLYTEPGWNMHTADGDRHRRLPGAARARSAATAPRRCAACGTHAKGGFYHDGRFATLARRGRPLRPDDVAAAERSREIRPGRVSEVTVSWLPGARR